MKRLKPMSLSSNTRNSRNLATSEAMLSEQTRNKSPTEFFLKHSQRMMQVQKDPSLGSLHSRIMKRAREYNPIMESMQIKQMRRETRSNSKERYKSEEKTQ